MLQSAISGGATKKPRMFTLSFHGSYRGDVFYLLELKMKLVGNSEGGGGDFHAMNGKAVGNHREHVMIPESWERGFGRHARPWRKVKDQLAKMGCPENYAPVWFVEHWAPAAIYSARRHKRKGSGVIVLDWHKFDLSQNCILEKLFCRCLVYKYPGSVYILRQKISKDASYSSGRTLRRHNSLSASISRSLKQLTGTS